MADASDHHDIDHDDIDHDDIRQLLDNYTRSVSTGDQALFESQLLDEQIPFFGVRQTLDESSVPDLKSVQTYAAFRARIFDSGTKYTQTFSDVAIEQRGDVAQVALTFRTLVAESGGGAEGWKILQLLRIGGRWKIASELYTVSPIAAPR